MENQYINIIEKILNTSNPVELLLTFIILGGVVWAILYLKVLKKAAKNDYHEMPELTKGILSAIQESQKVNHEDHMMMNANLAEIKGKIK